MAARAFVVKSIKAAKTWCFRSELLHGIVDRSANEFLCKECPRVHIHFERVDMKEIPPESVIFRRWLHKRFEIKDQMLTTFYESEDPDKKGKFPGEGQRSHLSITKTLPSLLFLGGLTLPMLLTESGRKLYVRTWVYGTLLGWLWVNVSP
ncbi:hypothetical protein J4Q44_G00004680 [Coregonus suidteri]|uniref:Acyltransferase C-terminal domain-containing protein n=1 Tax=Coregonus suidteri TaxID=861788 RepID=A0AAN8R6M8_9TELE